MSNELIKTIARVRRAMPRNVDVMEICDALEKRLQEPVELEDARRNHMMVAAKGIQARAEAEKDESRFDKKAYMRDYMRKKRGKSE